MKKNGPSRPILPRTISAYGEEEIAKAAIKSLHTDLPPKRDYDGNGLGKNYYTPLASLSRLGDSSSGETRKRRSPSPCRCEVYRNIPYEGYGLIRFHMPEAWKLSRVSISEGKCSLCDKERGIRDLQRVSRRLYFGSDTQDIWEDCNYDSGWKDSRRSESSGSRVLHDEQEKDRGLSRLDCQEEMPTEEDLDTLYLGGFFGDTFVDAEDNEVAEQEHVDRETIRSEGLVNPWQDNAWEDNLNNLIGQVFPYVSPPSG